MAPITRFAAFKYKPGTTIDQKREALAGLIKLYKDNERMVNHGPVGQSLSPAPYRLPS